MGVDRAVCRVWGGLGRLHPIDVEPNEILFIIGRRPGQDDLARAQILQVQITWVLEVVNGHWGCRGV